MSYFFGFILYSNYWKMDSLQEVYFFVEFEYFMEITGTVMLAQGIRALAKAD
jgi:hypothetical protein